VESREKPKIRGAGLSLRSMSGTNTSPVGLKGDCPLPSKMVCRFWDEGNARQPNSRTPIRQQR